MVASAIAGLGLATNNTVMIVASMLLSPLMNPILGFTLGTVMRDWVMFKIAVKAELAGLLATLLVGLAVGCIFAPWSGEFEWPTPEMESRGKTSALLIGLAFAVPAGAGVALSAAGSGGSNSLVGVAIAASLLPPVVNTGMCISFAFLGPALYGSDEFHRNEFLTIAYISFCLFLLNVGVIFAIAVTIFKLKGIKGIRRKSSMYATLPTVMTEEERENAYASARERASDSAASASSVASAKGAGSGRPKTIVGGRRGASPSAAVARKTSAQEKLSKLKAAAQSMMDTSNETKQEINAALAAEAEAGGGEAPTATAVVAVVPVAPAAATTVDTPLK